MDSGNIFVAMEYLRHGDLSKYAGTELQEMEIKEIADNVLRGLQVMHEEGFTHRDIKPQVRHSFF
jgi:serine/threonine protein kinase